MPPCYRHLPPLTGAQNPAEAEMLGGYELPISKDRMGPGYPELPRFSLQDAMGSTRWAAMSCSADSFPFSIPHSKSLQGPRFSTPHFRSTRFTAPARPLPDDRPEGSVGHHEREVLMLLRQILAEAVRRGLIASNPAALLNLPEKRQRKISVPELAVVQRVIATVSHPVARMFADLLVRTGLRTGEATALNWEDLENRKLHVRRTIDPATGKVTSPKTAESFRSIDIPQSLVDLLTVYRDENGEAAWLFPTAGDGPLDGRNFVQRYWALALRKAKAPHINPHALRHLLASHLLQQVVEVLYVANQLGHTSAAFTLHQYGHLLRDSSPSRAKLEGAFPPVEAPLVPGA